VHPYDTTLKSVIRRLSRSVLETLTGFPVERWHNVELPEVRTLRADMIGETAAGDVVHIELQSTNDADIALRMAEYSLAIYRLFRRLPRQLVLYVGRAPVRMTGSLAGPDVSFQCRVVDIRELDAAPLLMSKNLEDNVLVILMRLSNERDAVREILRRISAGQPAEREMALQELAILGGLRGLGAIIKQETTNMPILDDIMDHDLFGPAIRQGRLEGEKAILTRIIEKRFGSIPVSARQRLECMSVPELEDAALRLLDVGSLEDLLGK
jgi:hypothetical protein